MLPRASTRSRAGVQAQRGCHIVRINARAGARESGTRSVASITQPWRPSAVLDDWVQKEARPISLRTLTFFSRSMTESRLLSSANYLRTELPTRLAHRLRDMQQLPYVVVTNPHMSRVYELYYQAFDAFRRVKEIKTVHENDDYCVLVAEQLKTHLPVIPELAIGILECQGLMEPTAMDSFMNTALRSRISRRVIAEHHLALTETFNSPSKVPEAEKQIDPNVDFVGQIFLRCNAREVLETCGQLAQKLAREAYGSNFPVPEIKLQGHLEATFPYILNHLEYIIGELLRNSIQAVLERFKEKPDRMPPIQVLACEAPQHVIFRISDQGGGIPSDVLPYLWSFSKGPRREVSLENLQQVPKMAATMEELELAGSALSTIEDSDEVPRKQQVNSSLGTLTSRPPNLRLGIGLPMSRVYAEYWAGSLELQSLEGYGVDAFLQIPKLGNKNEQLTTRSSMDQV